MASAVLESVCERMKKEGTEYLFVNYGWTSWPKASHVVPVPFIDSSIQEEIMDCFPEGYCDPEEGDSSFKNTFKNGRESGFFKFTDTKRNEREHEKAMKKYKTWCKKLDEKRVSKVLNISHSFFTV